MYILLKDIKSDETQMMDKFGVISNEFESLSDSI